MDGTPPGDGGLTTAKDKTLSDPRLPAIPDIHGHAKGEHKPYAEERPIAYSARMLFLWFYHACQRGSPRFMMVADHINYLTFEDPGAVNTVRRALKLAQAGDLHGAAETADVEVAHARVVSEGLRKGMRFSIGAEIDNDPRTRPDVQNIIEGLRPDGMIRAVHFLTIDHPEKGADFSWPFDNPEFKDLFEVVGTERVWELYMAKLLDDIEKLPGHIVAHFYAPAIFGHWPARDVLDKYEDRFVEACAARGMAIEINTRFFYRDNPEQLKTKYRQASLRLLKKAKAKRVGIAIGSDAHSPKDQGNAFDIVLALLDEAGVNELVFPVSGRLARVALRATKEHMESAKPPERVLAGSSITGFSRAELGLPERDEAAERAAAALAKSKRDRSAKKRASSPARASKKPVKAASERAASAEAKDAKEKKPAAKPEKAVKAPKAAPAPKKPTAAKATPVPKKPIAKKAAAVTKPVAAAKKAAPQKPVPKKAPVKKAPVKKAPAKAVGKKSVPTRTPAKRSAPVKKTAPAKKAAPPKKSAPTKKVAAKKAPVPKRAVKLKATPAKKAPSKKKPAKKPIKRR